MLDIDIRELEDKADEVAVSLKSLGNQKRLMILCKLAQAGEMNVTALSDAVTLSQSALSQHLARMRTEGIVETRRDSQTIWYRIASKKTEQLIASLHHIYCVTNQ